MWVNKDNPDFHVTMGSYDKAEVSELMGLYILDILKKKLGNDQIGLFRDDILGCLQSLSGPESQKVKKKLCKIFKQSGVGITVECNLPITDFVDVTFDLPTGKYHPHRKVNKDLFHIHK